jgi:polysaccharide deacetylase family protein (PEP-CTERM system associated)
VRNANVFGTQVLPGRLEPIPFSPDTNVLSVDLEMWDEESCAGEAAYLLDLFRAKGARATFFVLGSVALREPDLIRRIASEGHEIASHGWDHEQIYKKSPKQFLEEMRCSFDTLSTLVGAPIAGFRAPHFSIDADTYWALDALAEIGFKYDSSIFPFAGPRYGVPGFPRAPVRILRNGRSLLEVPLSTVRAWGWNIPVAGGGYFRLLPRALIERAVQAVHEDGLPFVLYCHPYEYRAERLLVAPFPGFLGRTRAVVTEAKWNLFRQTLRGKLARVIGESAFTSIREAFGSAFGS